MRDARRLAGGHPPGMCRVARTPTRAAAGGRYVCEDGKAFLVEFVGDGSRAAVTYGNRKVALPQPISDADLMYSDG